MDVATLTIASDGRSRRKIINDRYAIVKKIGEGQYGKVLLAEDLGAPGTTRDHQRNEGNAQKYHHLHKVVAIKTINRIDRLRLITKTYLSHTTKIKREIQIMKNCSHPNVVRLYQVIDDLKYDKILLVLEYCKFGEIDWKHYNHYYEKYNKPHNGIRLNKILRDVINGLEYLHDCRKIIHRDLKPSNLLISHDNTIKISDFGVSLILENNANDDKELGKTVGTPAFYAPELCQFVNNRLSMIQNLDALAKDKSVKIDARIDIWSLGVILYCLMFNELPFNGFNEFELFKRIVEDDLRFPKFCKKSKATDDDVTEINQLKDLIKKILVKDPEMRIDIKSIKNHPFTLHDLKTSAERKKFLNLNSIIIREQLGPDPAAQNPVGLANKIKKFFTGSDRSVLPEAPISMPVIHSTPTISQASDLRKLQQVDDLLDSYLDSSSDESFGSVVETVDTDDLVKNLRKDSVEVSREAKEEPSPHSSINSGILKLSTLMTNKSDDMKIRPPPLSLMPPAIAHQGMHTPNSGSDTPTTSTTFMIGEASPSSLKSVFSPARRFRKQNRDSNSSTNSGDYSEPRNSNLRTTVRSSLSEDDSVKKKGNVTIHSLASPVRKESYSARDFAVPPSLFSHSATTTKPSEPSNPSISGQGNNNSNTNLSQLLQQALEDDDDFSFSKPPSSRYSNGSVISEYGQSRTSSFSEGGTSFAGLTRITSSSSLLNLNAYLTDDLLPKSLSGFNLDEKQQGRRKLYSDVISRSKWNQDEYYEDNDPLDNDSSVDEDDEDDDDADADADADDDDDDANNTTLVLIDSPEQQQYIRTMDQYLDKLD